MIKTRNVLHSASIFAVLGCVLGSAATAQTSQTAQNNAMQAPTSTSQPVVHDLPANVPGHTEYLDYLNGFRGIKFGTPVSQFKNLEVLHDRKEMCIRDRFSALGKLYSLGHAIDWRSILPVSYTHLQEDTKRTAR